MSTSYTISTFAHRKAQATTVCPTCHAQPGHRCTGVEPLTVGHYARARLYLVAAKPMPDEKAIAELTRVDGIRADAKSFVVWLSGEYEFRNVGASGRGLTLRVHAANDDRGICNVRNALVDIAIRHGLVVSAGAPGRTRYVVTSRGVEFHQQHSKPSAAP